MNCCTAAHHGQHPNASTSPHPRCIQLRSRLGTRIELCHLFVHVALGEEVNTGASLVTPNPNPKPNLNPKPKADPKLDPNPKPDTNPNTKTLSPTPSPSPTPTPTPSLL